MADLDNETVTPVGMTQRKPRRRKGTAQPAANQPPQPPPMQLPDLPKAQPGGPPDWAVVPKDLVVPTNRPVLFIRFRAAWTDTPLKGERQCVVWPVNVGDRRLAAGRANGDLNRISDELTKGMIRAIDGKIADWSGEPGAANIDTWWDDIGEKCRTLLARVYAQLHLVKADEARDFFENCVAVRFAGG